jgi:hypothetical protein
MLDKDNLLRDINRLCSLVETFLDSHARFNRDNLPAAQPVSRYDERFRRQDGESGQGTRPRNVRFQNAVLRGVLRHDAQLGEPAG